jgi:hypothetical protein
MQQNGGRNRINGLAELLAQSEADGAAPVDLWDPPYCGDIGLAITADGQWHYRNSPIGRERLVKLFARVLRRDEDGRYYLVTPVEKVDVAVEDAPFIAVEMERRGSGREQTLIFRTNVDDIVVCGPDRPLRFGRDEKQGCKPYVTVRGRLEALLSRAVTYELLELASTQNPGSGPAGVWSGGSFFAVETEP